jgi:hypothetical protein
MAVSVAKARLPVSGKKSELKQNIYTKEAI